MALYQSVTVEANLEKGLIVVEPIIEKKVITVGADIITQIRSSGDWERFFGPYTVVPTVDDQILDTDAKLMTDDVTVLAIPYTEVSNLAGGTTVNIA